MLKVLFYVCLLTLTLGQFTAITKDAGFNLYLFDLLVLVFSIFGCSYFLVLKSLKFPKYIEYLYVFIFIGALSLFLKPALYSNIEILVALFYLVRLLSYTTASLVLYNMLVSKLIALPAVIKAFVLSGLVISLLGFVQLLLLPDFSTLDQTLGWDPHKSRLASTFFDPNFTGAYLSLVLALTLSLGEKWKSSRNMALIVLLCALLLTFSRSAWLMCGIVFFIYSLIHNRRLLILSFLIVFLAYFAVPRIQTRISGITDPNDSAHYRIISWTQASEIVWDNMLFGVGFNAYRYAREDYGFIDPGTFGGNSGAGTDSSLLLVLATTGVAGFLFYITFYFRIFVNTLKFTNEFDVVMLSMLVGLFFGSLFINSMFYPQIMFIFFSFYSVWCFKSISVVST